MQKRKTRDIQARKRTLIQSASAAMNDVFDAIIELVTNADDAYQRHGDGKGRIDIIVTRHRGDKQSTLEVRDSAGGMDSERMEDVLSWMGGRESGLEHGEDVRGTHSRGAKDIAVMGKAQFRSIAEDGQLHECTIDRYLSFTLEASRSVDRKVREKLGIAKGTGTLVTLYMDPGYKIPHLDKLASNIGSLVALRSILKDQSRSLYVTDTGQKKTKKVHAPKLELTERVNTQLSLPSYPGVKAKLNIFRNKKKFERTFKRFRLGGILIQSGRAVHEATLFDAKLERDTHAEWYCGRVECKYIDDLCIEYDDWLERGDAPQPHNPKYLLDPSRKGLIKAHPFYKALAEAVVAYLAPLVEEERKREESEKAKIESHETRKRLNKLEAAASEFMKNHMDEEEPTREPDTKKIDRQVLVKGYSLSPPYCQMIVGESRKFWFTVRQAAFPEFEIGSQIQIECLTPEVSTDSPSVKLEPHPSEEGVLRAIWQVKADGATTTTAVSVESGPISTKAFIEVFRTEADKYAGICGLTFQRKSYRVPTDKKKKKVTVLCPINQAPMATDIVIESNSSDFTVSGQKILVPKENLGIARCDITVRSSGVEASGILTARLGEETASAAITSHEPVGAGISIRLEDKDFVNQRYRWQSNVLEIGARHPALKRYLGSKPDGFPGQETQHFRLLVAEIVAEAVCAKVLSRDTYDHPEEFEDADWDQYYSMYSKYVTEFLPRTHKLQVSKINTKR